MNKDNMGEPSWLADEQRLSEGIDEHLDYLLALVDCVDLPAELEDHGKTADNDPDYADSFEEWTGFLTGQDLCLALSCCCNEQGVLHPWVDRFSALQSLPDRLMGKLKFFFRACPIHVQYLLAHWVYWLVRFERLQNDSEDEPR